MIRSHTERSWMLHLLVLLALLCTVPPAVSAPPVDWEAALADCRRGEMECLYLTEGARTADERRQFINWIVREYPGSAVAAGFERELLDNLLKTMKVSKGHITGDAPLVPTEAGLLDDVGLEEIKSTRTKYTEMTDACASYVKRYTSYVSLYPTVALLDVIQSTGATDQEKRAAFAVLAPLLRAGTPTFEQGRKALRSLPVPPQERYALARSIAERSSNIPAIRAFHLAFLQDYCGTLPTADAIAECERFIKQYGEGHPEGRTARLLALQLGGAASAAKLAAFTAQERDIDTRLAQVFLSAADALDGKQYARAQQVLTDAMGQYPAYRAAEEWRAFLRNGSFTGAPLDAQLPMLRLILTCNPGQGVEEAAMAAATRQPAAVYAELQAQYFLDEAIDPESKHVYCEKALQDERVRANQPLWIKANWGAGEAFDRLGQTDTASDYLYAAGQKGWNVDRPLAMKALQRASTISPGSIGGISAGWLHGFLTGEQGYALSPLARVYPFPPSRELPAPALPKLAEDAATYTQLDGGIQPVKQNRDENLLADQQPLDVKTDPTQALAVDGRPETTWTPQTLPTMLTVPLSREATVKKISLQFTKPAYFTVTLLDRTGRVLTKYERDWSFQDYSRSKGLWPSEDVTLNLLPVDHVRFIQLTIFQFQEDEGRLKEIAVYGAPYTAQDTFTMAQTPIPAGTPALRVSWQPDEPSAKMTYGADLESSHHASHSRGGGPWWRRMDHRLYGVEFFGDNVTITANYVGILRWQVDEGAEGVIEQPENKTQVEHSLSNALTPGRHMLWISRQSFPAKQDQPGGGNIHLADVIVQGTCRARVFIAFVTGGKTGAWQGPLATPAGTVVAVPAGATHYVLKADFDNRELQGQQAAKIRKLSVTPTQEAGKSVAPFAGAAEFRFTEKLDDAVKAIVSRRVVVTYAKIGTQAEYDAAKVIAEKAGVYLVSDDLTAVNADTVPVVVGTPLNHRLARNLLGLAGIWNDSTFLNDPNGMVRVVYAPNGTPRMVFVVGETAEAVVRAATRLSKVLPTYTPPAEPFRLFASDTLEVIHAWHYRPDRAPLRALALRMAAGDRRSVQFGMTTNRTLTDLRITCSPLKSAKGAELPAVLVRPVGFYDFAPAFGDLRIPNVLIPAIRLPMPANTAEGIWLTLDTRRGGAAPGTYTGTVTVQSGAYSQTIPFQVTIEPINLVGASQATFGSFSSAPTHWFNEVEKDCVAAMRGRAATDADHGINLMSAGMRTTVTDIEKGVAPVQWGVAGEQDDDELAPDLDDGSLLGDIEPVAKDEKTTTAVPTTVAMNKVDWDAYSEKRVAVGKHGVCYLDFGKPTTVRDFLVTVTMHRDNKLILGWQMPNGTWQESAPSAPNPKEALPDKGFNDVREMMIAFRIQGKSSQYFRIRTDNGNKFSVGQITAYTDMTRKWPYTIDFTGLERQLDVYDSVYREKGLPLPTLLSSGVMAQSTFDKVVFGEQLRERLKATGRLDRFILTLGDEPGHIDNWAETARPYRETGLRTMTCHSGNYPNIETAVGVMGPWCPNYLHNVLRPFFRERQQAGDKVWWYCCGSPNTQLSGRPLDNLAFYWMTAKWRFDGGQSYASQDMNPALHQLPFRYEGGLVHRYVYLADGSTLDTTRRELEGEGIQDFTLVTYIRGKVAALRQAKRTAVADEAEAKLDSIFEQVVPYRSGYAGLPVQWFDGRNALYDLAIKVTEAMQ